VRIIPSLEDRGCVGPNACANLGKTFIYPSPAEQAAVLKTDLVHGPDYLETREQTDP
jgi:hypothetical protein